VVLGASVLLRLTCHRISRQGQGKTRGGHLRGKGALAVCGGPGRRRGGTITCRSRTQSSQTSERAQRKSLCAKKESFENEPERAMVLNLRSVPNDGIYYEGRNTHLGINSSPAPKAQAWVGRYAVGGTRHMMHGSGFGGRHH
jgi:hypothetical protein